MADMTGKRVIVTGGTNGIGEEAALELAKMGADVTVISRTESKLKTTVGKIEAAGGINADYIVADLSSIAEVRQAAAEFKTRHDRLDVLLNNAGAVFTERKESVDGIEMTLALNHVNYFLLTHELLELLKGTADAHGEARVVNVSSGAHQSGMHWNDIQYENGYNAMGAYGQSKAMNILFTYELARRLEDTGVTANALHPGFVATGFGRNNGWFVNGILNLIQPLMAKDADEGAETSIYLASSPEVKGVNGKYFVDEKPKKSADFTYDENSWTRLWEYTEKLIEQKSAQPA